jgi:hypothetical protein
MDERSIIYEKLPSDIAKRHVLLLDPILATGNSAVEAINILLTRGVPQNHILLVTLICAPKVRRGAFQLAQHLAPPDGDRATPAPAPAVLLTRMRCRGARGTNAGRAQRVQPLPGAARDHV